MHPGATAGKAVEPDNPRVRTHCSAALNTMLFYRDSFIAVHHDHDARCRMVSDCVDLIPKRDALCESALPTIHRQIHLQHIHAHTGT
jgi:hypothetical protein